MGSVQRDNSACLESLEGFLEHVLQGPIIEGLQSIREQAAEIATQSVGPLDDDEVSIMQKLLGAVKNWSQVLLNEEAMRISQTIPYMQKLLTALFVMKVKVLSCINMRKDSDDFPLTIPANTTFIHHVYINCASVLLEHPEVLDVLAVVHLIPLVREGIRKACFACIQWSELLAWGLDGVDVNDVVKSVMDDRQEEAASDESKHVDEDVSGNGSGMDDDDDFHDLANNGKMNGGDADADAKSTDEDGAFGESMKYGNDSGAHDMDSASGNADDDGSLFNFNDDSVSQADNVYDGHQQDRADETGEVGSSIGGSEGSVTGSNTQSDGLSTAVGGQHAMAARQMPRPVMHSPNAPRPVPPPPHPNDASRRVAGEAPTSFF